MRTRTARARAWAGPWMVAATLAGLAACGGGGGGSSPVAGGDGGAGGGGGGSGGTTPPPVLSASALAAAQPGELTSYFKTKLEQRASQGLASGGATAVSAPSLATAAPGAFSGTTLQEAGVDEDDLLKADGSMVYALHPAFSTAAEPSPARLTAERRAADGGLGGRTTATLASDFTPTGLYLAGSAQRLTVLGRKPAWDVVIANGGPVASILPFPNPSESRVSLDVFSTADAGRPAQTNRIEIDGSLVGSRMIGNVLYLVSTWTPDLMRYPVPANATREQAQAALANLSTADLLPRIRIDGQPAQPLVSESDCFLQPANASLGLQLTTLTAVDLGSAGLQRASRCFVGGVEALYMSPTNVYLASSRQYWTSGDSTRAVFPASAKTDIHKFGLQGLQITYRASGEVAGHLGWDNEKKPYRMSEYNGDLRVVTFTGESGWFGTPVSLTAPAGASPATVTVLRENSSDRSLQILATLPNGQKPAPLGKPGEQVYAVNFAGPIAYVVTFRRTDPLYVLDLSVPADPRLVGELAVPGFSDYLYPLAGGKLLGVGKDATADGRVGGIKVSLFDVANPAQPRELASRVLGAAGSISSLDASRHGINLFTQGTQVQMALPVRLTESATRSTAAQGLARFVVDTGAGTLTERPLAISTRFEGTSADGWKYSQFELGKERSLQSTQGAYYLSGGAVLFMP